jgi:hypothetical protein
MAKDTLEMPFITTVMSARRSGWWDGFDSLMGHSCIELNGSL